MPSYARLMASSAHLELSHCHFILILGSLEAILSSYAAVLASLGPILGCSWHACSPKNIVKYIIFVGFLRCFGNRVTYAFGCLLVLSWAAFWALLGSLLASPGPLGLPFGLSWASLGPILGHFGAFLGLSWRLLCLFRPILGHLWPACALGGLL